LPEHISRKELKQDRIHDAIEHSAEAVFSHSQMMLVIVVMVLVAALGYFGWSVYHDKQTAAASVAFDDAMKAYGGHIAGSPEPADPNGVSYPDEAARSRAAMQKLSMVADKYPSTNPGKLARYYAALCMENLEQQNQALEALKKIGSGGDKELANMANYQIATIQARTGKTDDAIKMYRALADKSSVFVPRPLVLLDLAGLLRQTNPKEAANVYQQIKKEFPDSAVSEAADRGLETL
jgi:predicted negative regulator of RcsB-dependent stress response